MTRPDSNPKQTVCLNTALLQELSGGSIRNRFPRRNIPPSSTEVLDGLEEADASMALRR
jgi:hypothetical protein